MSKAAPEELASQLAPSPPEHLAPSSQEVYQLLALEGPLTHRELVSYTEMPARTVRFAVRQLKEADQVDERVNLNDGRQRFFFLKREESTQTATNDAAL